MEKVECNGKNTHEVFKFLRSKCILHNKETNVTKEIPWNYCKFLISGDGKKVKYFSPKVDPITLKDDIDKFFEKQERDKARLEERKKEQAGC